MNKNYWKNAYKDFWEVAASKEKKIKNIIESETGFEVIEIGLGAGSTAFIEGNAKDNKLEKGDADLYVKEKECYIEVTGPNIKMDFDKPLWVRPDKLRNAYKKHKRGEGKLHVIVHVLIQKNNETVIRVIILDDLFFDHIINKKSFELVNPIIRGKKEEYYELPPEHETIISLKDFIKKLKEL
ncbi:hypothetical protein GWK08_08630 [Leptobacterium flavescens]|uniref:Uncharacterized protein n=1 Tax=Leptobacterium flavescens TaxID=472055 RepID=A0A6P0UNR5_9FLAO|nr:hypothetical protein [Leptobacterium flavescens]NER13499.1 hypothetical protein [Leptobacterium flavescens]